MSEERIDELLALAALGELDQADEAELDALLAADEHVASELRHDLETAARIQQSIAETPPAHLKADVMAALDAVPAPRSEAAEPPTVAPIGSARSARRRRWQPLAAAAAVVVLVAGGLFVASNRAGAPGPVDAVLEADDAVVKPFSGDLEGQLFAVFSPTLDALVIDGDGVTTVADDETYQVWLVDGENVVSVGLFRPDSEGTVATRFDGIDPGDQVVAVTVEPAGGSETPTFPIVAAT